MSVTVVELANANTALLTAIKLFSETQTREPDNTDLQKVLRDGCIQRFEFCMELAWKVSMKSLGLPAQAPHPSIREMAQNGLIDDPAIWFGFQLARNKTSHSYDEDIAKEVYQEIQKFIPALENLLTRLQKIK